MKRKAPDSAKSAAIPYLNDAKEFETAKFEAAESGKLLVVDFTASWCVPCKVIGPQFDAMDPQFPYVTFVKVDVDKTADVAQMCGVKAMPTFKFYRQGHEVATFTGADAHHLRTLLVEHGGPPTAIEVGKEVAVFDLQERPQYNGKRGIVCSHDLDKGHYAVELKAGADGAKETLNLTRDNLVLLQRVAFITPTDGSVGQLPEACAGCCEGDIVGYDAEANAYRVKPIREGGEPSTEELSVPVACCVLPPGSVGVVLGLNAKPEHNGKEVHIAGVHEGTGRYEVGLDATKSLRLKRSNVRM